MKESSDELIPIVKTTVGSSAKSVRTASDWIALIISTCGVGYLPLAPGTWGSLVGVGLYILIEFASLSYLFPYAAKNNLTLLSVDLPRIAFLLLITTIVTLVGIWAGSRAEKLIRRKDPGVVVIDEVAGQLLALSTLPMYIQSWWGIVSAFVLFRAFDILKPYPARRMESLDSGLGIMSDDIVAGAYAAVVNSVIIGIYYLVRA